MAIQVGEVPEGRGVATQVSEMSPVEVRLLIGRCPTIREITSPTNNCLSLIEKMELSTG